MLPKEIEFIFKYENSTAISKLIVFFVLISEKKNNYSIGPLISNEEGKIILTKKQVENTISQNQIDFPMDYSGGLNNCTDLEILIDTKKELARKAFTLKEFYPENALLLEQAIASCNNESISFDRKYSLPIKDERFFINCPANSAVKSKNNGHN